MSPLLMEALQLLKFSLKKECLNFMDGWATSEAAMLGTPKSTHNLSTLFMDSSDGVMDGILNECGAYDV